MSFNKLTYPLKPRKFFLMTSVAGPETGRITPHLWRKEPQKKKLPNLRQPLK